MFKNIFLMLALVSTLVFAQTNGNTNMNNINDIKVKMVIANELVITKESIALL